MATDNGFDEWLAAFTVTHGKTPSTRMTEYLREAYDGGRVMGLTQILDAVTPAIGVMCRAMTTDRVALKASSIVARDLAKVADIDLEKFIADRRAARSGLEN
jgi:hypothetical protein